MYRLKPLLLLLLILTSAFRYSLSEPSGTPHIVSYTVDLSISNLRLYWKDDQGKILGSIKNLKSYVEGKKSKLLFAMNGGMYKVDHSPQGLYIQDNVLLSPSDTSSGKGNFHLKPNGVFYMSYGPNGRTARICRTENFVHSEKIKYATQSGPMLICDGVINPAFKKGSDNLNIRNGVGILPDGKVVFAISKDKLNFYDFAMYFKNLDCKNALYLDGFVSRAYIPAEDWVQMDGDFGVMIGVTD